MELHLEPAWSTVKDFWASVSSSPKDWQSASHSLNSLYLTEGGLVLEKNKHVSHGFHSSEQTGLEKLWCRVSAQRPRFGGTAIFRQRQERRGSVSFSATTLRKKKKNCPCSSQTFRQLVKIRHSGGIQHNKMQTPITVLSRKVFSIAYVVQSRCSLNKSF